MSNIIETALQTCGGVEQQPISQETFLVEFRKVAECVAQKLKDQPVIVAHSENTLDGSSIKRLLSNKFELDKVSVLIFKLSSNICIKFLFSN